MPARSKQAMRDDFGIGRDFAQVGMKKFDQRMKVVSSLLVEKCDADETGIVAQAARATQTAPRRRLPQGRDCGDNGAAVASTRMSNLMTNFRTYLTAENVLLFAFMLLAEAAGVIFSATATEPPAGFELLRGLGYLYVVGYWLQVDSRRYGFKWVYCRGILLYLAGVIIVPYYLFKTRGARAFLTLGIFASMYAVSLLVGALAAALLIAPRFD
jgi:hypothetical protein